MFYILVLFVLSGICRDLYFYLFIFLLSPYFFLEIPIITFFGCICYILQLLLRCSLTASFFHCLPWVLHKKIMEFLWPHKYLDIGLFKIICQGCSFQKYIYLQPELIILSMKLFCWQIKFVLSDTILWYL